MPAETGTGVVWGHSALTLVLDTPPAGPVAVRTLSDSAPGGDPHPFGAGQPPFGTGQQQFRAGQPLVEVLVAGAGRARASHRFSETAAGRGLVYAGSSSGQDAGWHWLRVDARDDETGLAARVHFRSVDGVSGCQVRTTVTNHGRAPVLLLGVTSFAAGFPGSAVDLLDLVRGDSEWLGEGRWRRRPLRASAADLNLPLHGQDGRGRVAVTSLGTWSTGAHLPTGGLVDRDTGRAWLWQVEHNGPWRWEVGERLDGAYVALLGPTDIDHQWQHRLGPGESFTTVPASIAVSGGELAGAVAALTRHRRSIVRPHPDSSALPVVFNDYMNTLMGDPTAAKLMPLIDAAAGAGAEVFCVDAGWYDNGTAWWDSVGEWQPSQTRFPRGISEVLTRIRDRGMTPGLWLEPEVIGVRSTVADKLPPEAFLQRGGARLVEHNRYHLDLRHPRAVAHLDEVVDRLVEQLGVGYLKLDYNIDPGAGTDLDADSPGAGLLGHNRAHLAWLEGVLERHPGLILENCASGGMRMDYALLSRMQLQSTSDQQDFARYPAIAVAAPMSVLPEQSASWAYPQPEMTDEELAYALCTGMLGRLYLSGRLDGMSARQRDAVRRAVLAYRDIRADLARSVPLWPLGLPGWSDPWLCLGLRAGDTTYLALWRRDGVPAGASAGASASASASASGCADTNNANDTNATNAATSVALPLPHLRDVQVRVDVLYPRHLAGWAPEWDSETGLLTVRPTDPAPLSARIFRITPLPS